MRRNYRLKLNKKNCIRILGHELNIHGLKSRQCDFKKVLRKDQYFLYYRDSLQGENMQAFFIPWDGGIVCQIEHLSSNKTVTHKLDSSFLIDSGFVVFPALKSATQ